MKTKLYPFLLLTVIAFSSFSTCTNNTSNNGDSPDELPLCIQNKIDVISSQPVRNPAAKVYSYSFNGETVYYIPPYSGDFYSELFNSSCSLICHPDGGFTGMGDGNCPTFFSERTNQVLEWADPR